jgi:hypothetical protein
MSKELILSVDQNKSYFLHSPGGSKALIYGCPHPPQFLSGAVTGLRGPGSSISTSTRVDVLGYRRAEFRKNGVRVVTPGKFQPVARPRREQLVSGPGEGCQKSCLGTVLSEYAINPSTNSSARTGHPRGCWPAAASHACKHRRSQPILPLAKKQKQILAWGPLSETGIADRGYTPCGGNENAFKSPQASTKFFLIFGWEGL